MWRILYLSKVQRALEMPNTHSPCNRLSGCYKINELISDCTSHTYMHTCFKLSHTSIYEWFPYGTRRNRWKVRFILRASAVRRRAVWPQAALISLQSTGTLGRRPRRKLLIVPKWPLCQMWNVALKTFVFFSFSSWVWV